MVRRAWVIVGLVLIVAGVAAGPLQAAPADQQEVKVNMSFDRAHEPATFFEPATINVAVGTKVTWMDVSGNHSTTSDTSAWDSGVMAPGASFSFTFDRPGTYAYHCIPHQAAGMIGTVVVAGAQAAPGQLPRTGDAGTLGGAALALLGAGMAAFGWRLRRGRQE